MMFKTWPIDSVHLLYAFEDGSGALYQSELTGARYLWIFGQGFALVSDYMTHVQTLVWNEMVNFKNWWGEL